MTTNIINIFQGIGNSRKATTLWLKSEGAKKARHRHREDVIRSLWQLSSSGSVFSRVDEALKAGNYRPLPSFLSWGLFLTPMLACLINQMTEKGGKTHSQIISLQDRWMPAYQLAFVFSQLALLYFGQVPLALASLFFFATDLIDQQKPFGEKPSFIYQNVRFFLTFATAFATGGAWKLGELVLKTVLGYTGNELLSKFMEIDVSLAQFGESEKGGLLTQDVLTQLYDDAGTLVPNFGIPALAPLPAYKIDAGSMALIYPEGQNELREIFNSKDPQIVYYTQHIGSKVQEIEPKKGREVLQRLVEVYNQPSLLENLFIDVCVPSKSLSCFVKTLRILEEDRALFYTPSSSWKDLPFDLGMTSPSEIMYKMRRREKPLDIIFQMAAHQANNWEDVRGYKSSRMVEAVRKGLSLDERTCWWQTWAARQPDELCDNYKAMIKGRQFLQSDQAILFMLFEMGLVKLPTPVV